MTGSTPPADRPIAAVASRPLTPWILAGFGAILVVLIAALVVGPINLRSVYSTTESVARTQAVRAALQELLTTEVDAETGQRGFIITGQESYLEPYDRSLNTVADDATRVRALTADDPAQQEDLDRLMTSANNRLALIAESIRLRRESGFAAAQALVATGEGKRAMDEMRAIVGRMEAREDARLERRNARAAQNYRVAQVLGVVTPLLALLVLGLLFAGTRRFGAERRIAEQTAERLNVTLRSIGDAVVTTDDRGGVLRMNPVAQTLTGWTEADAAGRRLSDVLILVNEQTRRPADNPIDRVLRDGVIVGLANHTILVTRDGREIPIDDSAAPIRAADGRMLGVIMVFRDITERHRAEQERANLIEAERLAREQAELANRMKDEFLAIVSHELRTPLNAVLGWADMLRGGTLSGARRDRAIDAVYANAIRQAKLIDELLDVARIMSGKLRLERTTVDLPAVLRSAIDVIQPSAETKNIQIAVDLDDTIEPCYADQARLQQVLGNLLSNAVKFTPEGGAVRVGLERDGDGVIVRVADTGQGIPAEFIPYIFEPFRQVDQLTTRRHGGLGLGLSIVRHLIEAHGGTVRVESAGSGKGATFTVRLPIVEAATGNQDGDAAAAQPEAAGQTDVSRLEGIIVLAVDDDRDSRDLVAATLEGHGAMVLTASSAEQALQILRSTSVHVLLSDVAMPGEDGYTLIRRLRTIESNGTSHLPAATLTSLAREDDRQEALRAGFQLHLTKPINAPSLVEAVAMLADSGRRAN